MDRLNYAYWWAAQGEGPVIFSSDNPQLPNARVPLLESLCRNGPVYAEETRYEGTRYGKVAVKGDRIFVYSFQLGKPEARFISFRELLSRFGESTGLPKTVFLQLTPEGGMKETVEVLVETDGASRRSENFRLLCSALKGHSYKGMEMASAAVGSLDGRHFTHFYEIFPGPTPVVNVVPERDPGTQWREGAVHGMLEDYSGFKIPSSDYPPRSSPKIGDVVAGFQDLKDRQGRLCTVTECGLVI